MQRVTVTTEGCAACGGEVVIETNAHQGREGHWYAFAGDEGRCVDCGEKHIVDVYDDDDEPVTTLYSAADVEP